MTSNQVYVWVWLPGHVEPVVAGALKAHNDKYYFAYGRSYLERPDAFSLYPPELPFHRGEQAPEGSIAGCLRDAAPDAWGRRVILQSLLGRKSKDADPAVLDELTYMLESGSDRIGALDFQLSATEYIPREKDQVSLEQFQAIADKIAQGEELPNPLAKAVQHGTSVGGARPKVLIDDTDRKCIAKFSTSADQYNVVKAEYLAMRLAALAGLNVAPVVLGKAAGRDVLLIERFDRELTEAGWLRKSMVSALTILGLDEMTARYASYEDLAERIRQSFSRPKATLTELYRRMIFNVLVGNTDDHARNHAALWDGKSLALTPAYDICPQLRTGREASQAMRISGEDNLSRISTCLDAAASFQLSRDLAFDEVNRLIASIHEHWPAVVEEAELTAAEQNLFWRHQFLNPGIFDEGSNS